ncbi:cell surface protein [Tamlana nanhaiensis]|uniref:Cell surface protein n=1 Tax=Neotamlana nanhaiensis TaxID=1382798 RepID=A0A0D7W2K5_9FLAO|nr:DUF5074 domain-containing protein [Tamlana nanhaiensis]KJD33350.1 cell surface protein [Tamlana nanhaiensis]
MKINKLLTAIFVLSALFLTSCSSDDDSVSEPRSDYENGILISGEGSSAGTGSVSFISNDFTVAENLIYKTVNDVELGTYLQSMAFDDDNAYIVVDNANTITVADRYTFEYKGEITTGLSLPRFMVTANGKGYVTNWGSTADDTDDFIAVVDLSTYSIEKTISVGNGPERIVAHNGKLYVSHKGAYTTNNIVSVITIADDNVEEITVKDNPDELFFNTSGNLVVLSEGRTIYDANWNVTGHTLASISTINPNSLAVSQEVVFAEGEHPSLMEIDNGTIYYALNGSIYSLNESESTLPIASIMTAEGYLYGMAVQEDNIFTLDASFTDASTLNVYSVSTSEKVYTQSVAIGASKIYFN